MTRVGLFNDPDQVAEDLVPAVLAPAGEMLMDALPPFAADQLVVELGARVGLCTGPLAVRAHKAGARFVAVEQQRKLLAHVPRAAPLRIQAKLEQLPFASESVDHIAANCALLTRESSSRRALASAFRVLKPGGSLTMTTLLEGSFEELCDLLVEACEQASLFDLQAAVLDGRDEFVVEQGAVDALFETGFRHLSTGVAEHAVLFPDGPALIADTFVRRTALALVMRAHTTLPPEALARLSRAVDSYFEDTDFVVRIRLGVFRAERPAQDVLAPPKGM